MKKNIKKIAIEYQRGTAVPKDILLKMTKTMTKFQTYKRYYIGLIKSEN